MYIEVVVSRSGSVCLSSGAGRIKISDEQNEMLRDWLEACYTRPFPPRIVLSDQEQRELFARLGLTD